MALKLEKIYLKNWKCYQEQTIKFNLDTDKHIWIVFGQNGFGKTSILEAILWCLYGNDIFSREEILERFNRIEERKKPNLEILIQLTFKQGSSTYYISRSAKRIVRGKTPYAEVEEVTFSEDGTNNKGDVRERIEALLPKSCKDFFFFDGVEIKRYAKLTQTEETRRAIERILGIPELRNLRDDAKLALKQLEKKLDEIAENNQVLKKVRGDIYNIQEEIEIKIGQLQRAEEDYEAAQEILDGHKIRANQIEDLRSKLNEISRLENEKKRLQNDLNNAEKQIENTLKQAPIPLMLEFVNEMVDDLQSQSIIKARRSGSVAQLRNLLKSDICLCGRCIDEDARDYIIKQLEQIESSEQLTREALEKDNLRQRLESLASYKIPNLNELLLSRDGIQNNIDEVQQAIDRLKKETQGTKQEEVKEIWNKVLDQTKVVNEKEKKIEYLNRDIEQLRNKEGELRRKMEQLAVHDQETANLTQQVKLARGLHQAADKLISWRIEQCKQTIESQTSEIHRRVTNKPDEYVGIQIQQDYTLGIKNANGSILNPEMLSAGEKEALAFAFIAGLNVASGKAAPLMMDTPFGHLDNQHQKNIVNSLPILPSQVIVLATDRDFPDHLLQALRPYVAEIHQIRRLGATEDASVVEVEE
jgi:DNA sulfur modification protein DndD